MSTSRLVNMDALKAEIAESLSISAIAERLCGVDLQRSGNQWQGLCPIHSENSPSFYANDARSLYHCFGCFVAGTMVLTEHGYRPIETIQEGDRVVSHTGRLQRVAHTMVREAESTIVVRSTATLPLQTTPEHPFYVRRNMGRERLNSRRTPYGKRMLGSAQWVDANQLDSACLVSQIVPKGMKVPVSPVAKSHERDFYWIVGRYLADGWRCKAAPSAGNRRMLVICCAHGEADGLQERLNRVVHATRSERKSTTDFTISRVEWYNWLDAFGDGAAGKTLPGWVYSLPQKLQDSLLEGYLSGDGHRVDNEHLRGWRARSVSKSLALGVALLAQTARGVVASVTKMDLAPTTVIEDRVVHQRPAFVITIPDRNVRPQVSGEYGWKPVKSIEPGPAAMVYNLEVEGDNSYVVDNCVVHNCKAGGDGIDLVRRVRNLGFIEALYLLAAEADIEIEQYERPLTEEEKFRERFRGSCETWLSSLSAERVTRVQTPTAIDFGVGWSAGGEIDGVDDYLMRGVIFPYRMPNGRLVGWKARALDSKQMFGTPNDFLLHEETLFGIQVAREHLDDGRIVVVEGEYDCLAIHQEGVRKNVVAMGGSSLTAAHMQMFESLHVREVTVILDGDDAGRLAARSIAERFWSHDITVRVAVCSDGEDPDSLCKEHGDFAIDMLIRGARHTLEHLLWIEWESRPRGSLSSKLEFVSWIREHYGSKLRATDESLVLQEVAKWMDVPEIEVRDFVRQSDTSLQVTDSERVLLSAAIHNNAVYVDLRKRFIATDFYVVKHQRIWGVLGKMLIDGLTFDVPTISRLCEVEGVPAAYILDLTNVSSSNLEYHEEQVLDMSLRRAARDEAVAFKTDITDVNRTSEIVVSELTHRITERVLRKSGAAIRHIDDQVDTAMEVLHDRMKNPTEIHGLDLGTQFPEISRTLQGLQPRRLVLLSASSGVGKSTMMIQWITALSVHQSIPCDFVSLEMDEVEILTKMASHMTGIDSMNISGGRLDKDEMRKVEFAMARIRKSPLHVWAPDGMNSVEFLLYARESVMQRRTEAFFIDYIQLTDPDPGMERENGYTQFGHFGRMAKMKVARAMDVCVICCAQLKREAAGKERPTKEDMGDSYALVRHADVICIMSGQEDSATMDFWIDKNRQGIGGNVLRALIVDRATNTFREASGGARMPEYRVEL